MRYFNRFLPLILAFSLPSFSRAIEPVLKPGDTLAICGDSITEQKLYSVYIEDYLLACQPVMNVKTVQFGWSGEKADGFLARMENDVLRFKPSVATTCYGMNDGRYVKLTDEIANAYRSNMSKIIENFSMNKVRVVVGSPGCVDTATFKRPTAPAEEYNKTLAAERDIAKALADEKHLPFADVYEAMHDVMEKAKAKYGTGYSIAGSDGIHPAANGHVVMAYAFLKALGVSGDIGTITVDLAGKKAMASDGHTVKSFADDTVTIESTRYPFCFFPDRNKPTDLSAWNSMRGVLEFLPFNEDLNRLTLVVTGASGKVKITWGPDSKEFSADQVAKGINLAAEFLDNPFVEPFNTLHEGVRAQQAFETPVFKQLVNSRMKYGDLPGDAEGAMEKLIDQAEKADADLRNLALKTVVPVTHTIKIEVVK